MRFFNYLKQNSAVILVAAVLLSLVLVCISYERNLLQHEENRAYSEESHVRLTLKTHTGTSTITLKKGDIPVLADPVLDGYTFTGWTDNAGEAYTGEAIIRNTTLIAQWTPAIHTVTFANSSGTMNGQRIYEVQHNAVLTEEPEVTRDGYRFSGWYTDPECTAEFVLGKSRVTSDLTLWAGMTMVLEKDETLAAPSIYILAEEEISNINRDKYVSCTVTVDSAVQKYCVAEASAQIRGRGNSTWDCYQKKPYRLKFDEKTDLFGMGKARDWVLLANSVDMSMMRNYMVYKMAQSFDGCRYTTDCEFAHVYINGKYNGLYLICEQVEEGKNRVDIGDGTDSSGNPTLPEDTGFLMECGSPGGSRDFYSFSSKSYYGVTTGTVAIKSPEYTGLTREMVEYIENYVNDVVYTIGKNDFETLCTLVEIETFVDTFICNQIILSGDMGYVFFAYKEPGGKLCLGPLWDYDQSSGTSSYGGSSYEGFQAASPHTWYDKLIRNEEFRALVIARWQEKKNEIHSLTQIVEDAALRYTNDINKNYERWTNFLGTKQWRSLPEVDALKTHPEHVKYFTTWLSNRINWIEKELGIQ